MTSKPFSVNRELNLSISGDKKDAADLGRRLAERLIEKGANRLLEMTREIVENTKEAVI